MKVHLLLSLICIALLLSGCNQSNSSDDDNTNNPQQEIQQTISSQIQWKSGTPPDSSRVLSLNVQRSVANNADYTKYGTLITKLTPIKFKIPLQTVEIANTTSCFYPIPFHQFDTTTNKWVIQYCDFLTPQVSQPQGEIATGQYTDFTLFLFSRPGEMSMSSTPGIKAEFSPDVVVDLPPGYENYITSDVVYFTSCTNNTYYSKKIIDSPNSIYQFTLEQLYPIDESGNRIIQEIFTFTGNTYIVYYPGLNGVPACYDIKDYKKTKGTSIVGNNIYTIIPWEGLTVFPSTTSIIFELYFDLNNIIELYDNNTPDDKSDDILVLADQYWNRFKLVTKQYNSRGEEISQ